ARRRGIQPTRAGQAHAPTEFPLKDGYPATAVPGTNVGEVSRRGEAPTQYGPRVRALAVFLHDYQLVPTERTEEFLYDLLGCQVSEGSIQAWIEQASQRLEATMERIAAGVAASPVVHVDETGRCTGFIRPVRAF
ncbi:MAG TPA: transposase, partial [Ktedonobacteraceae bacterium]|nr:transposase [Ktedonobacteraceae bacterium]